MFNACQPDRHRVRVDTLLAAVFHTLVYIIMQNILCQPLFFTFCLLLPVFCHLLFAGLHPYPQTALSDNPVIKSDCIHPIKLLLRCKKLIFPPFIAIPPGYFLGLYFSIIIILLMASRKFAKSQRFLPSAKNQRFFTGVLCIGESCKASSPNRFCPEPVIPYNERCRKGFLCFPLPGCLQ